MFWNKSDHKKCGFFIVWNLFHDITSFESEKGDTTKLSREGFIYKQKDKNLYHWTVRDSFLNPTQTFRVLVYKQKQS